jgi:hypothetical protein
MAGNRIFSRWAKLRRKKLVANFGSRYGGTTMYLSSVMVNPQLVTQGLTLGLLSKHTHILLKELPPETRIFGSVSDDADAWPVRSLEAGVFDSERFAIIESVPAAKDYLEDLDDPLSEVGVLLTVQGPR